MNPHDLAPAALGCREYGPRCGKALILVHGAANDSDVWRDIAPLLAARGIRTIAIDLPGHGPAAGDAPPSVEAAANWLLEQLHSLQLERPIVAGHSLGSLIALEGAARAGERIGGLALLGTAVPMPVSPALLEAARNDPDGACRLVTIWSHTPRFLRTGGGGHGVWGPGKTLAVLRRNAATLANDLAACNAYAGGLVAAGAVHCPVLLVAGRRDRMTPRRALPALEEALRNASRREIADCGHAMMVEKPQETAKILGDFVTQYR